MRTVTAPTPSQLDRARNVIRQHFAPTPLWGTTLDAHPVWLKLETFQPTGSFKVRGALAALTATGNAGRIVTASAGNHALGVAWASRRLGIPATIVVAETAAPVKIAKLRALGADLVLHGATYDEAEAHGIALGSEPGNAYLSPYNDPDVIAGQATVGVEILADWPEVDTIVVPIGGGGLIAGIGLWAKAIKPGLRLIGVQPAASPPMYAHFETGSTDAMPIAPTLADGVSGNIEKSSITWKLCRQLVEEVVLVEEDAIAGAMRWALDVPHTLLEGSAVLGIAALQAGVLDVADRNVAVVTTGRNVGPETLRQVVGG